MPIQVIRENRRPSFGQKLGEGLGLALQAGMGAYQRHQGEKAKQEQFEKENDFAKQFGIDISGSTDPVLRRNMLMSGFENQMQERQRQKVLDLMGQREKPQKTQNPYLKLIEENAGRPQRSGILRPEFEEADDNSSPQNLSDEAINEIELYDPHLARDLRQQSQSRAEEKKEKTYSKLYSKGYKAIQSGNEEQLNEILSDPETPYKIKNKLVSLKNQSDVRGDVQKRELRNRQNIVQKSYKQAIDDQKQRLKIAPKMEHKGIGENIKRLQKFQKSDIKRLINNPEEYSNLDLWDIIAPQNEEGQLNEEGQFEELASGLPEEQAMEQQEQQPEQSMGREQGKIPFDPRNPEHVAIAKQALQKAGGDRARANQLLAEVFTK